MDAQEEFDVLLEMDGSKRHLTVTCDTALTVVERELGNFDKDISILPLGERIADQTDRSKPVYVLQRWSSKFMTYIDVTDKTEFTDGTRLTVSLLSRENHTSSSCSSEVLTKRATVVSTGLRSGASARAIRTLFPSSSSSAVKRVDSSSAFDPLEECVFSYQQKRKKAARDKSVQITVFVVKADTKCVPRGALRKRWIERKHLVRVELKRSFSSSAVRDTIAKETAHLKISNTFTLLECVGQRLVIASNQQPNGDAIIEDAQKRKGAVLYICPEVKVLLIDLSGGSPGPSQVIQNHVVTTTSTLCPTLTETLNKIASNHTPSQTTVVPAPSQTPVSELRSFQSPESSQILGTVTPDAELLEYRRVRSEQDIEFAESLRIDQAKACMARKVQEREDRVEHYRAILKAKYNNSDNEGGVKIAFKLATAEHTYCFPTTDPTRALYEYALAVGNQSCFSLYTTHPKKLLEISDVSIKESGLVVPTALFVEESDQDVLEMLFPPTSDMLKVDDKLPIKEQLKKFSTMRQAFVTDLPKQDSESFDIRRSEVYDDVLQLFKEDNVLHYYPLSICFVNERAIDCGGVCRDMLSAFWDEAYKRHFDGSSLLTPVVHAQSNMSDLPLLGKILSHGYLLEGYLPVQIAFPSLATILLGQVDIPERMLVASFVDSLSTVECQFLKGCLSIASTSEQFSSVVQGKLVDLLSRFGSRQMPSPSNLHLQLAQVAKFQFLTKSMGAHYVISSGIPSREREFWSQMSIEELYSLHLCLSATPDHVLDLLEEPIFMNPSQERVYGYLRDLVGNFSLDSTRLFLRFVTGSSVLSQTSIKVIFNNVSGLARCPIAHTCDSTLELSTSYATYAEFSSEVRAVLSATDCWIMDIF